MRCIRQDSARHGAPAIIELEMQGDEAWNCLVSIIRSGELDASMLPRAFRCLAAVSRHRDVARHGENARLLLTFVVHADIVVRTSAAHGLVWSSDLAERAVELGVDFPSEAEIVTAVLRALDLGVESQFEHSFREFVQRHVQAEE